VTRRILQLGNPLLREISAPNTDPIVASAVLEDLRDTLHEFRRTHGFGRGISAVQIGALERIIYMEVDGRSYSLINPCFEYRSAEEFRLWDDCFSFPDLLVWLERSETVCLRYTDEHGGEQILHAAGPLSELVQHEMDHLDGVLAIDRAIDKNSICTREEWLRCHARQIPIESNWEQLPTSQRADSPPSSAH
jgi:peptide deformylase